MHKLSNIETVIDKNSWFIGFGFGVDNKNYDAIEKDRIPGGNRK
jgi:hypothetical protein